MATELLYTAGAEREVVQMPWIMVGRLLNSETRYLCGLAIPFLSKYHGELKAPEQNKGLYTNVSTASLNKSSRRGTLTLSTDDRTDKCGIIHTVGHYSATT